MVPLSTKHKCKDAVKIGEFALESCYRQQIATKQIGEMYRKLRCTCMNLMCFVQSLYCVVEKRQ